MVLIARTMPKWCSAIGIVPICEAGVSKALDRMPVPAGHGEADVAELVLLSDPYFPSLQSLWFGNMTLDGDALYRVLRRHSYTLRELTLCNVCIDTSKSDQSGIVSQFMFLVQWLRRECLLDKVSFHGHIRDQFGTKIICAGIATPSKGSVIVKIEEYICGADPAADFPFSTLQSHGDRLLLGDVYSLGSRVYHGSKWRPLEIPLDEDDTWYVQDPSWWRLFWSMLIMLQGDLLGRLATAGRSAQRRLEPWLPWTMSILFFALGAASFVAAFSLGRFWAGQTGLTDHQDFAEEVRFVCSTGMLRARDGFALWDGEYITRLCSAAG